MPEPAPRAGAPRGASRPPEAARSARPAADGEALPPGADGEAPLPPMSRRETSPPPAAAPDDARPPAQAQAQGAAQGQGSATGGRTDGARTEAWRGGGLSWLVLAAGLGVCALAFSPSLIPRPWPFQALLAGVSFALGAWLAIAVRWLWRWLELPEPAALAARRTGQALSLAAAAGLAAGLWRSAGWQNATRALMGMPPVENMFHAPLRVSRRRAASAAGVALFLGLLVTAVDGTLVRGAIGLIDQVQAAVDVADPPGAEPPILPERSSGPGSLIAWDGLGRAGKRFVHEGPRAAEISAATGRPAREPIRAYVGLRAADDVEAQARLALDELTRAGGFERKILVIATPTGTGWLQNEAIAPLEYMHDGDTAVVGVQYSYLQSPLSLILEPGLAQASAREVFAVIHERWRSLPEATRPRLYVFGLSLGSLGSEASLPLNAWVRDPIKGALWAGPTFRNPFWRQVRRDRRAGSPDWRPVFEDGALVRTLGPSLPGAAYAEGWGPLRIVFLANPSDPIAFFEESMWWREPAWMKPPRGADVTPLFSWRPLTSFLLTAADMLSAADAPPGHGHDYAAQDYADAWAAVTAREGWGPLDSARIAARIRETDPDVER